MKKWLRENLFRSYLDGVVTLVSAALAIWVLTQLWNFVFVTGRWEIIQVNLKLLLVGRFPEESMWLVGLSMISLAFFIGLAAGSLRSTGLKARKITEIAIDVTRRFGLLLVLAAAIIYLAGTLDALLAGLQVFAALAVGRLLGGLKTTITWLKPIPKAIWLALWALLPIASIGFTLSVASLEEWGGFLINFYIAIVSIVLCFPLGILLALGRRSSFPVLRLLSTTYIELIRGAPLFVLLLLAGVALEFFIPPEIAPDVIFRSVTVFTLFTAAYLAEIIRGGLQSIPKGQTEAGKALGLSTVKIIYLITLPQALRNVIPAQIGQFISLFKDTTLAGAALSVFEVLNIGKAITKQDDFLGQGMIYESLAFVALLFWVGSFVMSRESQRLEKKLGVGVR